MTKNLLCFVFSLCFLSLCNAQIRFEKGYFIEFGGKKTECLIRNAEWKNNPKEFQYKLNNASPIEVGTYNTVVEFGILSGNTKYVSSTVLIDRSESKARYLSKTKEPEFKKEKLFLKQIVEGDANLYSYADGQLTRFFYASAENQIEQLVYKKYITGINRISENELYKAQLWENLKCGSITLEMIQSLKYNRENLVQFFNDFNTCSDSNYIALNDKPANQQSEWFKFGVRAGANFASVEFDDPSNDRLTTDFGSQTNLRVGLDFQIILPFNRNKWALTVQPMYHSFSSNLESSEGSASVDYKSIEFPVGIRHSFFLSRSTELFIGSSFVLDFPLNSVFEFENSSNDFPIEANTISANFSLGLKFAKKYSLEAVFYTNRDLTQDFAFFTSNYSSTAIILGYTLF